MAYLIDRRHVLWTKQLVAIVSGRSRGRRSHATLSDGSLYQTLTRPKTLALALQKLARCPLGQVGARKRRPAAETKDPRGPARHVRTRQRTRRQSAR